MHVQRPNGMKRKRNMGKSETGKFKLQRAFIYKDENGTYMTLLICVRPRPTAFQEQRSIQKVQCVLVYNTFSRTLSYYCT